MPAARRLARPTLPLTLAPQLCTAAKVAPRGDDWVHEVKYDGWRLLARRDGAGVRLFTRGGHDWTARLPSIAAAVAALPLTRAWLDGELVVLDRDGFPDFEALPTAMRAPGQPRLFYHVFDAPWWDGRDLRSAPLLERKARLASLADAHPRVRYTGHFTEDGAEVFAHVDALDLEGIVSKHASSHYDAGVRARSWLKVKCWRTEMFAVGGIAHNREGRVEALLVGTPTAGGLRYEGRVEFGLGALGERWQVLRALACSECPFTGESTGQERAWVRPEFALAVRSLPRRPGRLLRHAIVGY